MIRIIISVEGGCIQGIKADSEDLDISILDADEISLASDDNTVDDFNALEKEYLELPYSGF